MGCSSSEEASAPPGGPARVPLAELPPGSRFRLLYQGFPVEVRRADDGSVAARSLLCTHTGCEVVWMPARQLYHCPCHEGLFDADGRVVAGFPPRPLRDVPARIEGEEVVVGEDV